MTSSNMVTVQLTELQALSLYYAAIKGYADMSESDYVLDSALIKLEQAIEGKQADYELN